MKIKFSDVAKYIDNLDNLSKGILIEYIQEHQRSCCLYNEQSLSMATLKKLRQSLKQGDQEEGSE